ncbi:MAG TPA: hypothetical protein VK986_00935 [Tepidisphaeraceae bacterium]|nr:hypothetical protein [Tepidisphaeraceae bacterium]
MRIANRFGAGMWAGVGMIAGGAGAATIPVGAYAGSPGTNTVSAQSTGGTGGNGYKTTGTASTVFVGGTFTGGSGGTSTVPGTAGTNRGGGGGYGYWSLTDQVVTIGGPVAMTGGAGGAAAGTPFVTGGRGQAGVWFADTGRFDITGGTFAGGGGGAATGNIPTGGDGGAAILVLSTGAATRFTITGGAFAGGAGGDATSTTNAGAGGWGGAALDLSNAIGMVSGGTFTEGRAGTGRTPGEAGVDFYVTNNSMLTMDGSFDTAGPITGGFGSFTGRLAGNAQPDTYTYFVGGNSQITFVPEPGGVGLTVLAAGLVGGRRSRGRRA